ncbi:MAG: hypothetical protein DRO05_03195 [Thermoproteota archaeon]|nr:MAG: hypothetical protein DRO05_03195 [Candidatus Korarchaeota archaeon]
MKKNLRLLAIDDSPFKRDYDETTFLVGLTFRGMTLERADKVRITIDGEDAQRGIVRLYEMGGREANIILLHGTTFAGFNIVDIVSLRRQVGVPIAAFLEKPPREQLIIKTLERLFPAKIHIFLSNPAYEEFNTPRGILYCARVGISESEIQDLISTYTIESKLPEPIRIAHIVAGLLSR